MRLSLLCLVLLTVGDAGCRQDPPPPPPTAEAPRAAVPPAPDVCANADGGLDGASFAIATSPHPGTRVSSGFAVEGCSRTFERTVQWRLLGRDGSTLASGYAQGGGAEGVGRFHFTVDFSVTERQVGHLEVLEPRVTDEGFPPGRTVAPLVLVP